MLFYLNVHGIGAMVLEHIKLLLIKATRRSSELERGRERV